MELLEHPPRDLWEARRTWFESVEERARGGAAYIVSEQACALVAEVQACFCVGAWAAVVVMAMAESTTVVKHRTHPLFAELQPTSAIQQPTHSLISECY